MAKENLKEKELKDQRRILRKPRREILKGLEKRPKKTQKKKNYRTKEKA